MRGLYRRRATVIGSLPQCTICPLVPRPQFTVVSMLKSFWSPGEQVFIIFSPLGLDAGDVGSQSTVGGTNDSLIIMVVDYFK